MDQGRGESKEGRKVCKIGRDIKKEGLLRWADFCLSDVNIVIIVLKLFGEFAL